MLYMHVVIDTRIARMCSRPYATDNTFTHGEHRTKRFPVMLERKPSWIAPLGDHLYAVVGRQLVRIL